MVRKKLRKHYDILAKHYDNFYNNPQINYMHEIERDIMLKYLKKGIALDIGCGTGEQTLFLANRNIEVIGLDISNEMIKKALEKAKNKNLLDYASFIVGSGEYLPFKKETFNNIFSFFGALNHMPKYDLAIKEISRVLKKKGIVTISVANDYSIHWFFQEIKKGFSSLIKNFSKNEEYIFIKINGEILNIWTHYFSPKNLISLFKKNYFKIIKIGSIYFIVPPSYFPSKDKKVNFSLRILFFIENIFRWIYPFNFFGEYLFLISEKL